MTTAVAPIEKNRLQAYKAMTPATQELAKQFEEKLGHGAMAVVTMQYNIGSQIAHITKPENEEQYGSKAVPLLADYLNISQGATTLYNLRNFAMKFDKDFVKEWSLKPMASGNYLTLHHWLQVMKIKDEDKITKVLKKTLVESWSASDLEKEIRSGGAGKQTNTRGGGRNPKMPTSPIAGLQKTFSMLQKFNRFEEAAEESIFGAIEELEPDKVSDALLERITEVQGQAETTIEKAKEVVQHCTKAAKRVRKVLDARPEPSEEEEAPKKSPKSSGKVTAKAKPSTNGHSDNGNGAPKKTKKPKKKAVVEA